MYGYTKCIKYVYKLIQDDILPPLQLVHLWKQWSFCYFNQHSKFCWLKAICIIFSVRSNEKWADSSSHAGHCIITITCLVPGKPNKIPGGTMHNGGLRWLTHWGRGKIYVISQTTFSSAFPWMKTVESLLWFHWNMFLVANQWNDSISSGNDLEPKTRQAII